MSDSAISTPGLVHTNSFVQISAPFPVPGLMYTVKLRFETGRGQSCKTKGGWVPESPPAQEHPFWTSCGREMNFYCVKPMGLGVYVLQQ